MDDFSIHVYHLETVQQVNNLVNESITQVSQTNNKIVDKLKLASTV